MSKSEASSRALVRLINTSPSVLDKGKESTFVGLSFSLYIRFNFWDSLLLTNTNERVYWLPSTASFIWTKGKGGTLPFVLFVISKCGLSLFCFVGIFNNFAEFDLVCDVGSCADRFECSFFLDRSRKSPGCISQASHTGQDTGTLYTLREAAKQGYAVFVLISLYLYVYHRLWILAGKWEKGNRPSGPLFLQRSGDTPTQSRKA